MSAHTRRALLHIKAFVEHAQRQNDFHRQVILQGIAEICREALEQLDDYETEAIRPRSLLRLN